MPSSDWLRVCSNAKLTWGSWSESAAAQSRSWGWWRLSTWWPRPEAAQRSASHPPAPAWQTMWTKQADSEARPNTGWVSCTSHVSCCELGLGPNESLFETFPSRVKKIVFLCFFLCLKRSFYKMSFPPRLFTAMWTKTDGIFSDVAGLTTQNVGFQWPHHWGKQGLFWERYDQTVKCVPSTVTYM